MIALPTLEKQRQIARIAELRKREQELVKKIELQKSKLIDVLTMRAVTRSILRTELENIEKKLFIV
jgi:hypothetical protein